MIPTEITIAVQIIEWFKEITGFSNQQFLDYMNKNDVWSILNDTSIIKGCMWAEESDIINLLGQHLTPLDRHRILLKLNTV